MHKANLVFLDTETTGVGSEDRLCQVAYKFHDMEMTGLFRPPVPIGIDAMAISHITNKMVLDKEIFLNSAMYKDLVEIFSKGRIFVAHNADFDVEMLRRENLAIEKRIDTFKLAQYLDVNGEVPKYALQYLRYYYALDVENAPAHDALGDIRVLEKLFDYYFEQMQKKEKDVEKVIQEMLTVSARPILIKKFNFGKYAGTEVAKVAQENRGYLQWLLNEKTRMKEQEESNDENWIYTLKHYLG